MILTMLDVSRLFISPILVTHYSGVTSGDGISLQTILKQHFVKSETKERLEEDNENKGLL